MIRSIFLLSTLLAITFPAEAELYSWHDESGTMRVEETPPPRSCKSSDCLKYYAPIDQLKEREIKDEKLRVEQKKAQEVKDEKLRVEHEVWRNLNRRLDGAAEKSKPIELSPRQIELQHMYKSGYAYGQSARKNNLYENGKYCYNSDFKDAGMRDAFNAGCHMGIKNYYSIYSDEYYEHFRLRGIEY